MKISDVKAFPVHLGRDMLVVKVETDAGIYGLGEAGCSTRELAEAAAVMHFREFLIGMDPMRVEHIWQVCYRSNYHEGGRVLTGALSAIDIALWDIRGKALGVPVYDLLGGACRDRVYGFATTRSRPEAACVKEAQRLVEEGWPALRIGPATALPPWTRGAAGGTTPTEMYEPRAVIAKNAALLSEVRSAVDPAIPIGIDMHHRLSVAEAASFCQMMPSGTLAFLEEPIRNETPSAYEALRRMTDVPFAIGEEWASKWQALPYIERDITTFCRLDVCNIGGLSEAKKVAGWCEAHYVDLMPHNPLGPVCTAATIHLCFAVNNFAWVECNPGVNESGGALFPVTLRRDGPAYPLPDRPGLGVVIDESVIDAHGHQMSEVPHFYKPDGSHTNW